MSLSGVGRTFLWREKLDHLFEHMFY